MANVLGELFGDIASAIREKTGDAEKMKPAEFPEKISAIETGADVSAVTAEAEDVLEGKTIVDASGNPVAGAMVNHGSVLKNLYFYENYPQNTYTIPKGYHDGTGKVKAEYSAKTITPTKNEQTVRGNRVGQGAPIIYDFLGKVTVKPIPDQYQDVTPVTATAEDVRAGKVFVDAQGNAVEGALSGTIADVSGVTATAADVRQGKVIVDAQGNEVVGTLVVEQKAPDVIWVGKDSVSNALVGTGVVRYVTFMNDDGTAVYGQKSVLVGTDCIEPVAGGYMDAPTKESTAEHTFTFSGGWATEPGGGINADALKNVTEDRTVYANFISAVRYYTITYLDSDGTTVLKTESLAYGATPSYKPTSADYTFAGWVPEAATVTGDASYTATWKAKPAFATATWAEIKEIADAGLASTVFSVGDSRTVTMKFGSVTEKVTWVIADMDDEYGYNENSFYDFFDETPHIALVAGHAIKTAGEQQLNDYRYVSDFEDSSLYSYVSGTLSNALPEDMRNAIKDIYGNRLNNGTGTSSKLTLPFADVIGSTSVRGSAKYCGRPFALFNSNASRVRTLGANGSAVAYWTSYKNSNKSNNTTTYYDYVDTTGAVINKDSNNMYVMTTHAVVPMCFI